MRTRIGHLLVRDDLITDAQLSRALEVQNFAGGRIGTLLMERGALGEDELGRALALQHGCGYVPWSVLCNIPADTIATLPPRFALKHCAVPYEKGEGYVKMALRDPSDLRILDELVFVTGRRVFAAVAPEVRIYQSLEKYYGKLRAPRYAILAEKLSRPQRIQRQRPGAPPPPDFFPAEPEAASVPGEARPPADVVLEDAPEEGSPVAAAVSSSPQPASEPPPLPPLPQAGPPAWAAFLAKPDPESEGHPEGIAWEESTGGRSRPRAEPAPPPPFEEVVAFDFGGIQPEGLQPEGLQPEDLPEPDFTRVRDAGSRDGIADAVLDAMALRFQRAAIFASRSEGVSGWAAVGEGVDPAALRRFSATWMDPSVFLNARLSRTFYLGPLPDLPRHDQIAASLGGWPQECVVEPVFIGEKPVAFLLGVPGPEGSVSAKDLAYLRELAETASTAFENAIRLKKKEI
ncbi:MAG TPA: hypothetical protein VKH43_01605 [Thermoanaerobaculia bacterium]|nr:hypothetical protein [Thermoanaerobaculia bacterium]